MYERNNIKFMLCISDCCHEEYTKGVLDFSHFHSFNPALDPAAKKRKLPVKFIQQHNLSRVHMQLLPAQGAPTVIVDEVHVSLSVADCEVKRRTLDVMDRMSGK
ncbi:basic endochitinase [Anopheles sinensis]|uniref:Basic endochitinase n=1 Tax=Anopheles sinensis TaxID=74873 RepID=A0A084WDH6_ANOSI|nr:basic endochitinase [Anopheles sinensis]